MTCPKKAHANNNPAFDEATIQRETDLLSLPTCIIVNVYPHSLMPLNPKESDQKEPQL